MRESVPDAHICAYPVQTYTDAHVRCAYGNAGPPGDDCGGSAGDHRGATGSYCDGNRDRDSETNGNPDAYGDIHTNPHDATVPMSFIRRESIPCENLGDSNQHRGKPGSVGRTIHIG